MSNLPSIYENTVEILRVAASPVGEMDPGAITLAAGLAQALHAALTQRAEILQRRLREPCSCGGNVEARTEPGGSTGYYCRACGIVVYPMRTMTSGGNSVTVR